MQACKKIISGNCPGPARSDYSVKFLMPRLWFIIIYLLCFPSISPAEYSRLETEHFFFYFLPSDKPLANHLMHRAEDVRAQIVSDLGVEFANKTRVYLAANEDEFRQLQPQKSKKPVWVDGLAYPALNLIILKTSRTQGESPGNITKNFIHEFTHINIGRAFKWRKIPQWLNEGLAMYESREWQLGRVSNMTRAVLTEKLIPLRDLTKEFPLGYQRATLAYDQSFYLVSYLLSKKGRGAFHRFIREYGRGKKLEQVLSEVYGLSLAGLEKEWKTHLKLRFSWLPLAFSTSTLWFVITMVFLVSYWRKRKESQIIQNEWENEEEQEISIN